MTIALGLAPPRDPSAFMVQLAPVLPAAPRLAFAILGRSEEAEDAVQEAALKAWRSFGRFRPGSEIKPWFLTITANECRQRRRNRWWSVERGAPPEARFDPAVSADVLDLRRSLTGLPIEMRTVLALRYYLDLSFEEMGLVLGCSPGAAKARIHRAISRLRMEMPEEVGS